MSLAGEMLALTMRGAFGPAAHDRLRRDRVDLNATASLRKGDLGGDPAIQPHGTDFPPAPSQSAAFDGSPFADICGALRMIRSPLLTPSLTSMNRGELSDVDGVVLDGSDPQAVRTD
jgi:hypothetical protein